MFSCTKAQHIYRKNTVQILHIEQLNCIYSNYTETTPTCSASQQHSTFTVQMLHKQYSLHLNCTTIITQKLLLHVQLNISTAHLLYKYCTNCTVCIWTVLTVITQKLLLHVQLHNSTAHWLYKYCANCTLCIWTVLTVITQKLLLHVQLHKSTIHLQYKYCTNCTVCNWSVITVITQKLMLRVQQHNSTAEYIYCTNTVQTLQSATELYLQ